MLLCPDLVLFDGALRPACVRVDDGRITEVVPQATTLEEGETWVPLPGRWLLPGFVNTHSHAFQRGLRGHVQHAVGEDSFWTWRETMYRLANELDPDGIEAVSALAFLEMLLAGFTHVGEFHYLHHQADGAPYAEPDELALRVAAAADLAGIGMTLLRVAYGRAGFGVAPNPRQRRFLDAGPEGALAAVARLRKRGLRAGLAPHSTRACPADWLRAFAGFDGVIHAHVDEQPGEIEAALREHGRRPLQVFGDAGLLGPRFTAVHLTHPDADELALLRATGAGVCACPTTELDLGDGFLPARALDGAPVCIGTDSHALIDPFVEARSLEWHTRAVEGRRNVLRHEGPDGLALRLLDAASGAGARALGLEDAGRIAPGQRADLVAVDANAVALQGARPLPALCFAGHAGMVRDVWVGGRRVVEDGRHPGAERIVGRARAALRRVGL